MQLWRVIWSMEFCWCKIGCGNRIQKHFRGYEAQAFSGHTKMCGPSIPTLNQVNMDGTDAVDEMIATITSEGSANSTILSFGISNHNNTMRSTSYSESNIQYASLQRWFAMKQIRAELIQNPCGVGLDFNRSLFIETHFFIAQTIKPQSICNRKTSHKNQRTPVKERTIAISRKKEQSPFHEQQLASPWCSSSIRSPHHVLIPVPDSFNLSGLIDHSSWNSRYNRITPSIRKGSPFDKHETLISTNDLRLRSYQSFLMQWAAVTTFWIFSKCKCHHLFSFSQASRDSGRPRAAQVPINDEK
jgi:hypothetical protein